MDCFQQDLHLIATDIIPIVRKSWRKAFANIQNNLKAIRDRGWDPYNFILLFDPVIRATMTEDMIEWEKDCGLFPLETKGYLHDVNYVEKGGKVYLKSVKHVDSSMSKLNFKGGAIAQHVASNIMTEVDRQIARERNQMMKTEGTTKRERILAIKKRMTAGKLVLDGRSYHLDMNVLKHVRSRRIEVQLEAVEKRRKADLEYLQQCYKATKVLEKYGNLDVRKWKRKEDIVTLLKPLKRTGDTAMPIKRADIERRYEDWKFRSRRTVEEDVVVMNLFENWKLDEEEQGN